MMGLKTKVGAKSAVSLAREARRGNGDRRPITVSGARELVPILAKELRAGGDPSAVVEQDFDGAAALVWVGAAEEDRLRSADRARIPIVAVTEAETVPYVLAEDLVRIEPGQGFPVDEIAAAVARRLGDDGLGLASRLPVLRRAVADHLIRTTSRRNGLIGAAVFVPGVDMPILTFNQVRLVLRLAIAHGEQLDRNRALELAGVVGAGFGFRAIARTLLDFVPLAGWAVKGAIAYTGTRAIGEAADRYFDARSEGAPSGPGPTLSETDGR
jgi:uncharacterized protein (DUF697 family)